MNKILIVDGSNLLFQMFYGMPSRIVNQNGKPIQGTLGFVGALLRIIRLVQPTHLAVLFDGEHPNDRALLDSDYKANRPDFSQIPEEDSPFSQLPDVYAALDHLGIKHTETIDCETDDWIAAYALTYGHTDRVVIASFDSDFFQLVSDTVSVLRYRGEKTVIYTPEEIKEKFGISPARYADYKAMVGDGADNIKGAEKIGPKTAAALLCEFGSLESILSCAERIGKTSIRESVIRNTQRLKLNYQLIRLDGHTALPFSLDELKYSGTTATTNEVLTQIGLK